MKAKIWMWLSILWMLFIWLLSSLPSQQLPSYKIWGLDKIAHFGVYAIWGILANIWLWKRESAPNKLWLWAGIMLCIAGADEAHQYFIPGRELSVYDFLANAVGLCAAFILFWLVGKKVLR